MISLSPQEKKVAACLLEAMSDKEIADRVGIKPRTCKAYLRMVALKLGIDGPMNRIKLAVKLWELRDVLEL